jgi:hypothetical protein
VGGIQDGECYLPHGSSNGIEGGRPRIREASRARAPDLPVLGECTTHERPGRRRTVDREYQHALDEARDHAVCYGIVDEREEVVAHWAEAKSWVVPPVVVSGDLLGGGSGFELLVGYTRLGNLLGMLDREEVKEAQSHLVWVGKELRERG